MKPVVFRWAVLFLLMVTSAGAANKTSVSLLLGQSAATPGSRIQAALRMSSPPHWHTYWRNGGDSGFQTTVQWELPPGVSVSPFQWPVPEKLSITKLDSYVYEGDVLLPFTLNIGADVPPGPLQIKGAVSWLECDDETCVPAEDNVQASLTIGSQAQPGEHAERIREALRLIPTADPQLQVAARWIDPPSTEKRTLEVEWTPRTTPDKPDFYPYESEKYYVSPSSRVIQASDKAIQLRTKVSKLEGDWPTEIPGLILDQSGKEPKAYEVVLKVDGGPVGVTPPSGNAAVSSEAPVTFWVALALAFLGGMLLNIMPCVLPVVALKVLGFVNQSKENPARVKRLGLVYGAGVLASFLVLAIFALLVQRGGNEAAWGMQMQNPVFVTVMISVLLLASLNLLGVFELVLGGRALGTASELASREGASGAFFNGVFTTLLATPCTAPALGVALGFAFAQPPLILTLLLLTVGFGLAVPYVVLCFVPAWLRFIPKPGAWMEKFKQAMAFPLLATMAWLFWVATALLGPDASLWLGMFLVTLSLAAWVYGAFIQRGTKRLPLAWAVILLTLSFGIFFILERKLQWRNPPEFVEANAAAGAGIDWQPWSTEAVEAARRAGHVVFVDFTARWCITCQSNKKLALETEAFQSKLKQVNGVAFKADFTRRSQVIAQELIKYNRRGVPLNLVFPADLSKPAIILPNILKTSTVLAALEQAAGANSRD